MFGIGWTEILVILVVALLILGPSKLPEIAKGLGRGIRDFKKAVNSLDDDEPPRRADHQRPPFARNDPPAVELPAPMPDASSSGTPDSDPLPSEAPAEAEDVERTRKGP